MKKLNPGAYSSAWGLDKLSVGRSQEKGFGEKFWTVRENWSVVGCEQEEGVPDKGNLNRERSVTKTFKFPSCTRVYMIWTGTDGVYTERHVNMYSDKVPSKKRKAKMEILKIILSFTGSQCNSLSSGLTCLCRFLRKTTFAVWSWTFCSLCIWSQLFRTRIRKLYFTRTVV